MLKKIKDPRQKEKIEYPLTYLLWMGILMFLLKIKARRQIKYEFNTKEFVDNLNILAGTNQQTISHPDTLAHLIEKISPEEISVICPKMINQLIRMKCLTKDRLLDQWYVIAIDGTKHLDFGTKRHCCHCLSRRQNGKTIYFHQVLEAKLITTTGMALSIDTEFIENEKEYDKQDCELKAFYRLANRMKKTFPQLKMCMVFDSLYANQQVFEICRQTNWKYIIRFKKGSIPTLYQEALTIVSLQQDNSGNYRTDTVTQQYQWATDLEHKGHIVNFLKCREITKNSKVEKTFTWLTNIEITKDNFEAIANKGGRLRWKIENEGFNIQKNGGYELEHIYSRHTTAVKNFYFFLQIAHFINQLMEKGSLLKDRIKKVFGGIRNFTRRLLEGLRTRSVPPERLQQIISVPFQIRFDSS